MTKFNTFGSSTLAIFIITITGFFLRKNPVNKIILKLLVKTTKNVLSMPSVCLYFPSLRVLLDIQWWHREIYEKLPGTGACVHSEFRGISPLGNCNHFSLSNEKQWESAYYYSILKFTKPINGMLGDVYVMALIKHILWLLLYMG